MLAVNRLLDLRVHTGILPTLPRPCKAGGPKARIWAPDTLEKFPSDACEDSGKFGRSRIVYLTMRASARRSNPRFDAVFRTPPRRGPLIVEDKLDPGRAAYDFFRLLVQSAVRAKAAFLEALESKHKKVPEIFIRQKIPSAFGQNTMPVYR